MLDYVALSLRHHAHAGAYFKENMNARWVLNECYEALFLAEAI